MTDDEARELMRLVKETHAIVTRLEARAPTPAKTKTKAKPTGEIADDYDLDGRYGDEVIRKLPSPKYWAGEDFTGVKMSECTVEFLDAFARYKDACAYMAAKEGKPEKEKYIGFDRQSATRARGWAQRMRDGKVRPGELRAVPPPTDDDIPF